MFEIDPKSRKSISEQITDNIKELIISGVIVPGKKMLSVRDLAGQLTVNPNTVQKAYKTLEQTGYIYTSPGRGTFAADPKTLRVSKDDIEKAKISIGESLDKLYFLGLSKSDAEQIIADMLHERGEWK